MYLFMQKMLKFWKLKLKIKRRKLIKFHKIKDKMLKFWKLKLKIKRRKLSKFHKIKDKMLLNSSIRKLKKIQK
jgi:hypothetical protein